MLIRLSIILFLVFDLSINYAQENESVFDINNVLVLEIDSIVKPIDKESETECLRFIVYFNIRNISDDTVTFYTNSCPSYNLYKLSFNDTTYSFNEHIRCSFNSLTPHTISPNETVLINDVLLGPILNFTAGNIKINFSIPLFKRNSSFQIGGDNSLANYAELSYSGFALFIEHLLIKEPDNKKRTRLKKN